RARAAWPRRRAEPAGSRGILRGGAPGDACMMRRRRDVRFRDRRDAGRQLSERLVGSRLHDPLILALPRGGVPVAFEVAKALSAPLDVFIVRKIGAPGQPELGIGAIAEGGEVVAYGAALRRLGLTKTRFAQLA